MGPVGQPLNPGCRIRLPRMMFFGGFFWVRGAPNRPTGGEQPRHRIHAETEGLLFLIVALVH